MISTIAPPPQKKKTPTTTLSHSFTSTFQFSKQYLLAQFNLRKDSLVHLSGKVKASKMS